MKKQFVLLNFGAPRTQEEIGKFLKDLFGDKYIFDLPLPEFFRKRLGRFIAEKRVSKVRASYAAMGFGGGSPLYDNTLEQAKAVQAYLKARTGEDWDYKVGMSCGEPNLSGFDPGDLVPNSGNVIVPLFPQYSRSTVLSMNRQIENITGFCPANPEKRKCSGCASSEKGRGNCSEEFSGWVPPFFRDSEYIEACTDQIVDFLSGRTEGSSAVPDWSGITLLFSAHGIPMRLVKKGDSYPQEAEENVRMFEKSLRTKGFQGKVCLSYQSRVGPAKWTEPSTPDMLRKLASENQKRIAVYPVSFVSDHLETLFEIGVEFRELAHHAGIQEFYRIPAPGIYPKFISFLGNRILKASMM